MILELSEHRLKVTREKGDPAYQNGGWGTAESRLLYHIKQRLNAQGMDLIKKRMWRDGHLVSEDQLYLRPRSRKSPPPHIVIWSGMFQIEDAGRALMRDGTFEFLVERDIWKEEVKQ